MAPAASALRILVAVVFAMASAITACSPPTTPVLIPGEYEIDVESTVLAIEAELGRPMSRKESRAFSANVAILAPWLTINADGSFAWDNRPKRHHPPGPDGVAVVVRPIGWTGGSGSYEIRSGRDLVLNYETVSEGGRPGDVTLFGACHVHRIRGPFIRWRYGRDCEKFVLLRRH